jgi:glycosyltransferase involved in cell wall biosynthesis
VTEDSPPLTRIGRPLRVLQLLSNPVVGGTETFVMGLVPQLNAMGIESQIANLWNGGAEMGRLSGQRRIPFVALDAGERRFKASAPFILRSFLRENRFDIVMVYGLRATLLLRLATRLGPHPIIVTGLRQMDEWRRWYHVWPDRLTEGCVDYFVGVSRNVCRRRVERERTPREKVLFIPNGIDTEYFRRDARPWPSRADLKLPPGRLCVTVANLRSTKGYPFQLDVIERLKPLPEDLHFVWVGRGPDEAMLRELAAAKGVADRVVFVGHLDDVRPVLAHADLFFLSSNDEGMPRAMMEAMSMGLPALVTGIAGNAEVVRDQQDGLVVTYGDVPAAAGALRRLAEDEELRRRLGASAARRIRDDFSFDGIAHRYADLYLRIAARDTTICRDFAF